MYDHTTEDKLVLPFRKSVWHFFINLSFAYVPYYSALVLPEHRLVYEKPCILCTVPNRTTTTETYTQKLKIIHTAIIFKMDIDLDMVIEYKIKQCITESVYL